MATLTPAAIQNLRITDIRTQGFDPECPDLPMTEKQREIQAEIDRWNAMNYDQDILPRYGDLKPAHVSTFEDSTLGGNFKAANNAWALGCAERAYYFYNAKAFAICAGSSLVALPAKIYYFVTHKFAEDNSPRMADMRARDVQNLKDAPLYIFLGTILALGYGTMALLLDPAIMLWRYVDKHYIHPGLRAAWFSVDTQFAFLPRAQIRLSNGQWYNVPAGSLSTVLPHAWNAIRVINTRILPNFLGKKVGCKDWHPKDHGSFGDMLGVQPFNMTHLDGRPQMAWTRHAVQGSLDAEYVPGLEAVHDRIFTKGVNQNVDSYSGFYDVGGLNETLAREYLVEQLQTDVIFMGGIAYDYCVGYSAIDAARVLGVNPNDPEHANGKRVIVVTDASSGTVDQDGNPAASNAERTQEMQNAGVEFATSDQLMNGQIGFNRFFRRAPQFIAPQDQPPVLEGV